jgi:hypothetical protein
MPMIKVMTSLKTLMTNLQAVKTSLLSLVFLRFLLVNNALAIA